MSLHIQVPDLCNFCGGFKTHINGCNYEIPSAKVEEVEAGRSKPSHTKVDHSNHDTPVSSVRQDGSLDTNYATLLAFSLSSIAVTNAIETVVNLASSSDSSFGGFSGGDSGGGGASSNW